MSPARCGVCGAEAQKERESGAYSIRHDVECSERSGPAATVIEVTHSDDDGLECTHWESYCGFVECDENNPIANVHNEDDAIDYLSTHYRETHNVAPPMGIAERRERI